MEELSRAFVLERLNQFSWLSQECPCLTPVQVDEYDQRFVELSALPYHFPSENLCCGYGDLCGVFFITATILNRAAPMYLSISSGSPYMVAFSIYHYFVSICVHFCSMCSPLSTYLLIRFCSSLLLTAIAWISSRERQIAERSNRIVMVVFLHNSVQKQIEER